MNDEFPTEWKFHGMNRMIWRRLVKEHKLIYVEVTDGRK